jgi:hypothetical protein
MTPANPLHPQPNSPDDTKARDRLGGIRRTGGLVSTVGAEIGTYQFLENADQ